MERESRVSPISRVAFPVALTLTVVALAVVAGRAIADDTIPVGDDAVVAVHAHDVLSSRTPLFGMPTTLGGNEYAGRVHHLGPLEFWFLAIPERVSGSHPAGVTVGVALLAALAVVAIAWAARRAGGDGAAVAALAFTGVAMWSLGRQVLVDAWNPHVALLPLLALMFSVWAATARASMALPVAAAAASFAAQAHLVYAPLALGLFVVAAVVVVAGPPAVRALIATAAALAAAWALPVGQQLLGERGNLLEVWRAWTADQPEPALGSRFALRAVARAIGIPPLFTQPDDAVDPFTDALPVGIAVSATLFVALLSVATVLAANARDRSAVAATVTAWSALAFTFAPMARLPQVFPDVPRYRVLLLWPVGAFCWFAAAFALARRAPVRIRAAAVAAAALVLIVALPGAVFADSYRREDPRVADGVRALAREAGRQLPDGAVRVDATGDTANLVRYGMFRELRRRGVDTRVGRDDAYLGDDYAAPAEAPVLLVVGGADGAPPAGAREVARWSGATAAERDEFRAAERALRDRLATPAALTERAATAPFADAAVLADLVAGRADVTGLVVDGTLLRLYVEGYLHPRVMDPQLTDRLQELRYAVEELELVAYLVTSKTRALTVQPREVRRPRL